MRPRRRSKCPWPGSFGGMAAAITLLFALSACADSSADLAAPELDWTEEEGYRWADLPAPPPGGPGFEIVPPSHSGVDFSNALSEESIVQNRNLLNGSGVAVGDVTGDGFPDLYFARLEGPNVLYENLGGYRFRDITEGSGVALPDQFSTGATFADLNGDGLLDLVVSSNDAPNRLFWNQGEGRFEEAEGALAADRNYGSTSIAIGDLTGNGAPDIYIANYKARSVRDIYPYEDQFRFIVEQVDDEYRVTEKFQDHYMLDQRDDYLLWFETGEPDLLYLNRGDGTFEHVPLDSGILHDAEGNPITEPLLDWGLHVKIGDLTDDGLADIYLANDFESPDRIWINQGDGTFRALDPLAMRKSSLSSMAVDFGDLDRDGHTDFMVVEMLSRRHDLRIRQMGTMAPSPQPIGAITNRPNYMGNTLFMNRGDGTWSEISEYAGVRRSEWSWSVLFLDMTLDGYEDALVATGHFYDVQDSDANNQLRAQLAAGQIDASRSMLAYPPLRVPNMAFRNRGDLTFEEVSADWGFTEEDVSHGMALGDLNFSGVPDLVINRIGEPARIFRNTIDRPRVAVRVKGRAPNTGAIGARLRFLGGPVEQTKEVTAGGTYLSGSAPHYVFAPGDEPGPFRIEVTWPDGTRSMVEDVRSDRIYELDQAGLPATQPGEGADPSAEIATGTESDTEGADAQWFRDRTAELDHQHVETPFDDFERQPLLPWRLSQDGPATTWFDWTGNGLDDLFVGSGRGGALAFYENRGGTLVPGALPPLTSEAAESDQAGIVGFQDEGGRSHLLVGLAAWEGEEPVSHIVHLSRSSAGAVQVDTLVVPGTSLGPLAVADWSGDGRLDLFVGGRATPGRYPEPSPSYLFRNVEGAFELDEAASSALGPVGMVTGAIFADLVGGPGPELALATDWGPVRVFEFDDGMPVERTDDLGLSQLTGWWRGIAAGDLTGDGRLDLVVTNHGTNFRTRSVTTAPPRLYYADVNQNGFLEVIEANFDPHLEDWVPRRGPSIMAAAMPYIMDRNRTHAEFAVRGLSEVVGPTLDRFEYVEAATTEHHVFLNRGETFEPVPLPVEAQLAPAFAPVIEDFDGDGQLDLFLSQNFFAYELETPRSDAGRSLLLRGDGEGGFEAVPGHETGLLVWGEQRGAAATDLDGDGRVDLVVSQNGTDTRLFANQTATPGVRVRLEGPPANPLGIGARVRAVGADGSEGPARLVSAGSGYWSQGSVRPVLTASGDGLQGIVVTWPDGSETRTDVNAGATEVTIRWEGDEGG